MPIVSKSTRGALRTMTTVWKLDAIGNTVNYHLAAGTTLNSRSVGQAPVGFAPFFTRVIQSLIFTPSIASGTVTIRVTGRNQFSNQNPSELVFEDLVLTGTTAQQTTLCYRQVTAVTIMAISAGSTTGAADTLTIGYSLVNARVPMLAKLSTASSVLSAVDAGQGTLGSQPVPTAQTVVAGASATERYNILMTGTLIQATNGVGRVSVYVDPADSGL